MKYVREANLDDVGQVQAFYAEKITSILKVAINISIFSVLQVMY